MTDRLVALQFDTGEFVTVNCFFVRRLGGRGLLSYRSSGIALSRLTTQRAPRSTSSAAGKPMSEINIQKCMEVAVSAAIEAGGVIREGFHNRKKVELKGKVDLVTDSDKRCEALILSAIQSNFPDHKFIGEEGSSAQGFTNDLTDEPTWMVDPIDGTTNFVHAFPFVCVSIGLAVNRQVKVGVVYNPILEETYTAVKGQGAFLNGEQIHVSETADLGDALVATELGISRDPETVEAIFGRVQKLAENVRGLRAAGSCALNMCSVAKGRLDSYYEIGVGGPWDMAAASLIVAEAGGTLLDPAGGAFNLMSRRVLATNGQLGPRVAAVIGGCPLGPSEPGPLP
eukprot:jgi/Botrbrau1/7941/Bobra.9_2s0099.1